MISARARRLFASLHRAEAVFSFFSSLESQAAAERDRFAELRMEASEVLTEFEKLLLAIPEEERFE